MAKRRGFFAELQHQAAVAERDRQRANAAAVREMQKQQREAEQARAKAQRARTAASRANDKERAAAEREAKKLHAEAQVAQVEALNAALESTLADVDSVLEWTLGVDDHVDLEELRRVAEHPEFKSKHLAPLAPPAPVYAPPEPTFVEPPAPTGVGAMFGKKKHAQAVEVARQEFTRVHAMWQAEAAAVPMRQLEQATKHQAAETERQAKLAADEATYAAQSQVRQSKVDTENAQLDAIIAALAVGEKTAVEEYFGIVFGNSVYPDPVNLDIEHSYNPVEKELEVAVGLPKPDGHPHGAGLQVHQGAATRSPRPPRQPRSSATATPPRARHRAPHPARGVGVRPSRTRRHDRAHRRRRTHRPRYRAAHHHAPGRSRCRTAATSRASTWPTSPRSRRSSTSRPSCRKTRTP